MHHTFTESVSLGIMCNLMVCLALWMSYCGRSLCDKIVAMILPITLFVASGFEHCIANLFVIPFAIAIRHFAPTSFWQLAHSSADHFPALTVSHFITANLLPVMLGNIIGGAVLVSICYRAIYLRQEPKISPAKQFVGLKIILARFAHRAGVNHGFDQRRQWNGEEYAPESPQTTEDHY